MRCSRSSRGTCRQLGPKPVSSQARTSLFLLAPLILVPLIAGPLGGQSSGRVAVPIRPCVDSVMGCGLAASNPLPPPGADRIDQVAPRGIAQILWVGDAYFVATLDPDSPLLRVSDGGRVATVGRPGEGPGEFRGPLALFRWNGDTVAVFDRIQARITLVHSSGRIGRTQRFPRQTFALAPRENGTAIISAPINAPSAIGLPLHDIDSTGLVSRSIGTVERRFSERDKTMLLEFVALSEGKLTSFTRAGSYSWDRWGAGERTRTSWRRTVPWYPPYPQFLDPSPDRPPPPHLTGVAAEGDSLVWIAIALPAPDWAKAFGPEKLVEGHTIRPVTDRGALFRTRFELLRVRDGAILGAIALPGFFPYFVAPGVVMRQVTTPDGALAAELIRLSRTR